MTSRDGNIYFHFVTKAVDSLIFGFFFLFLKRVCISENIQKNVQIETKDTNAWKVDFFLPRRKPVLLWAAGVLCVQWVEQPDLCEEPYRKAVQHLDLVTAVIFLYLIKSYYRNTPFKVIPVSHEDYLGGLFVSVTVMTWIIYI